METRWVVFQLSVVNVRLDGLISAPGLLIVAPGLNTTETALVMAGLDESLTLSKRSITFDTGREVRLTSTV